MRVYNNKELFQFLFLVRRSDTLAKLKWLILILIVYSLLVAYLELEYFQLTEKSWLKNLPVMHSLLSFVISMLLVFRTNTAYDRWWEGRKLWGSLVNNSRNFAIKLQAILGEKEEDSQRFFRKAIPMYAFALKEHLRSRQTKFSLDEEKSIEVGLLPMNYDKHVPNQIAGQLFKKVNELYTTKKITGDQLIILNGEVSSFTDICGACERILNTPIPYSYSAFIKKFIMIYVLTLPWGYSFSLGYWAAPIVGFIFYVLASLELIAEEIEEPFGTDANDLPMDKMSENIDRHVGEIFG